MPTKHSQPPDELAAALRHGAELADASDAWPRSSWNSLANHGALGWPIPRQFGGTELPAEELLRGYERLAGACLTTTFILSQRDAAVRRIVAAGRDDLNAELLPSLATGRSFATVGLSQLTTSRQHGAPALRGEFKDDRVCLTGVIPWVSGADQAEHIVAGAVLPDGQQILVALPTTVSGIRVGPPMPLASLAGSRTTEVSCDGVAVDRRWLLAGPAQQVLSSARGGAGGLETSCLALGHAGAAIDDLVAESAVRPELKPLAERMESARVNLRSELQKLATDGVTAEAAVALRARANALVIRATQAALTAAKGAGFVRPHPAQRRARQALFFLVWSCPRAAAEATLGYLGDGPACA